jgi:hypothetical protein
MNITNTQTLKIFLAVAATLLIFSFQNCSKTNFANTPDPVAEKADSGNPSVDPNVVFQPNDAEDNQEDQEDVTDNSQLPQDSGVAITPAQPDPNFPEYDPGDSEGQTGYNNGGTTDPVVGPMPTEGSPAPATPPVAGETPSTTLPDDTSSPVIPVSTPPVLSDVPHNDASDVPSAPPVWSTDADASESCRLFREQNAPQTFDFTYNTPLAIVFKRTGSVLVTNAELLFAFHDRGPMFISSPLTGQFSPLRKKIVASTLLRLRGPLCITSATAGGGFIRRIINHRGFAEINNMNIFKIRRLRGALVIRDSKVDRIIHHRGPIVLINSKVGKIRNQIGPIYLVGNSTVGKYKNIRQFKRQPLRN